MGGYGRVNCDRSESRKQMICLTTLHKLVGQNYYGPNFGHLVISVVRRTYRTALQALKLDCHRVAFVHLLAPPPSTRRSLRIFSSRSATPRLAQRVASPRGLTTITTTRTRSATEMTGISTCQIRLSVVTSVIIT